MRERALLSIALSVGLALGLAAVSWSIRIDAAWFGGLEMGMVGAGVIAAAVLAVSLARDLVAPRIWVAALLAMCVPALRVAELMGHGLSYETWDSGPLANLCALVVAVGAVGLLARRGWARWLALAGVGVGLGTGGLNGVQSLSDPWVLTWISALCVCFSGLVGVSLGGPRMRAVFESEDDVWGASDPVVRKIRWTVLSQLIATPMLLVYAWTQPVVGCTATPAVVLAAVLGAGALLCMQRKILGAVLLTLAGPALLILTGVTAWLASHSGTPGDLNVVGYYAAFWVPAGVIATVTGLSLARPLVKLWQRLPLE